MSDYEDYLPGEAPTAHKTTHQDGGTDEVNIEGLTGISSYMAAHILLPTVHQDAPALIATHKGDAGAHHARYTDGEAATQAYAQIAIHAALPTVHQDAPTLILTHKGDASAHHTKYTDVEAIAAIRTDNIIMALNKYFKGLIEIIGYMPQEFLMNGGFEETDGTNAYYWTSGTGIATETSGGDDSNKYYKVTRSGSDKYTFYCNPDGSTHHFEVNEGEVYEFGGSFKSDGTCSYFLSLGTCDKDKAWIGNSDFLVGTDAAWTSKSGTYTVPAGIKFLLLRAYALTADGWAAFDNVYLKRVDEKAWSFTDASDRTKLDVAKLYNVTLGDPDSGGVGYRCLRVPN